MLKKKSALQLQELIYIIFSTIFKNKTVILNCNNVSKYFSF